MIFGDPSNHRAGTGPSRSHSLLTAPGRLFEPTEVMGSIDFEHHSWKRIPVLGSVCFCGDQKEDSAHESCIEKEDPFRVSARSLEI